MPNSLSHSALLAVIASPSHMLSAQQSKPWEQIPIPTLHDFHPQQPKRIELKNGIVIFLQEDHELPFVSGSVLIPGGSRDEDPAKAGLIGIYGQAWRTSGTAKMDGDAMDDLLEAKAAHIETEGDDDSTALSWDSLKGDADQVFSLAMDLLLPSQVQRGKAAAGPAAGSHRHRAPQRRRRRNRRARSRPSWSTARTAPTRASPSWPPSARSRSPICRPGTIARSRASSSSASAATSIPRPWKPRCARPSKPLPPVTSRAAAPR